jgi:VanZ family protein
MQKMLRWMAYGSACFIVVASLLPGSNGESRWHYDKIGHFLAYCALMVLILLAFHSKRAKWLGFAVSFCLGALMEWLQAYVPGRDRAIADQIANSLGLFGGLGLYALFGNEIRKALYALAAAAKKMVMN